MDAATDAINAFIRNPDNHDLLTMIKAARNGLVYGTKIRFPHALVMTLLFRQGTPKAKALAILNATRQHATNLATFALIYKSLMLLLRHTAYPPSKTPHTPRPDAEPSAHSFVSGLVAGYCVFGRRAAAASSVNQQIVIYVFARVVLGLAKLAVSPTAPRVDALKAGYGDVRKGGLGVLDQVVQVLPGIDGDEARERFKRRVARDSWAVFASVSWAGVMWLFRWHPDVLQPSLRGSMKYLYDNAEVWDSWKNLVWHNT